jgi:hypothetical protein
LKFKISVKQKIPGKVRAKQAIGRAQTMPHMATSMYPNHQAPYQRGSDESSMSALSQLNINKIHDYYLRLCRLSPVTPNLQQRSAADQPKRRTEHCEAVENS